MSRRISYRGYNRHEVRKIALALSALVVCAWIALAAYTILAAARGESGWSLAHANLVFEAFMAFAALTFIWGVVLIVEWIGRLSREARTPPSGLG